LEWVAVRVGGWTLAKKDNQGRAQLLSRRTARIGSDTATATATACHGFRGLTAGYDNSKKNLRELPQQRAAEVAIPPRKLDQAVQSCQQFSVVIRGNAVAAVSVSVA
jgi:hypothetical protein